MNVYPKEELCVLTARSSTAGLSHIESNMGKMLYNPFFIIHVLSLNLLFCINRESWVMNSTSQRFGHNILWGSEGIRMPDKQF